MGKTIKLETSTSQPKHITHSTLTLLFKDYPSALNHLQPKLLSSF